MLNKGDGKCKILLQYQGAMVNKDDGECATIRYNTSWAMLNKSDRECKVVLYFKQQYNTITSLAMLNKGDRDCKVSQSVSHGCPSRATKTSVTP